MNVQSHIKFGMIIYRYWDFGAFSGAIRQRWTLLLWNWQLYHLCIHQLTSCYN